VAYELTAEPQMVALCHCKDCQHISGGEPMAVALVPPGGFRLTQGTLKAFRTRAASGNVADRHFCADCGSQLASRLDGGPFVAVMVGNLDEPLDMSPQVEVWTSTAQAWAHHPEGTTRFEQNAG